MPLNSKWTLDDISEDNPKLNTYLEERKYKNADKTDVEFYVCVVFQNTQQATEFLNAIGDIPTLYNQYVDGEVLAKKLGIRLTPCKAKPYEDRTIGRLKKLALNHNSNKKKGGD